MKAAELLRSAVERRYVFLPPGKTAVPLSGFNRVRSDQQTSRGGRGGCLLKLDVSHGRCCTCTQAVSRGARAAQHFAVPHAPQAANQCSHIVHVGAHMYALALLPGVEPVAKPERGKAVAGGPGASQAGA